MTKKKYLWYTDTHLLFPWNRYFMLDCILYEKPDAVFHTGDISYGPTLIGDLEFFGKRLDIPFYFVLGNHDQHFSDIETVHDKIREVCNKYPNLIWLSDSDVIQLQENISIIGDMGWIDMQEGNTKYIKYTFDWFLIKDYREMKTWDERFASFRKLAEDSADILCDKLKTALKTSNTVYLLTHFVPWKEATRYESLLAKEFWAPYNTNAVLGQELEEIMADYKEKNLVVLCGHVHQPSTIKVSSNIECRVGRGAYHKLAGDEIIYL